MIEYPKTWEEAYDILNEYVGVEQQALDLAFAMGGRTMETANNILFYFTGWGNFEGFIDEINEDWN